MSEEKIFENGGRRTDGRRTTDGRTTEHGYTISSPCEPDGSGELKREVTVERLFSCGSEYTKTMFQTKLKNVFWKDVFKAFLEFQRQTKVDIDSSNILQMPVFDNESLTIGRESFFL